MIGDATKRMFHRSCHGPLPSYFSRSFTQTNHIYRARTHTANTYRTRKRRLAAFRERKKLFVWERGSQPIILAVQRSGFSRISCKDPRLCTLAWYTVPWHACQCSTELERIELILLDEEVLKNTNWVDPRPI